MGPDILIILIIVLILVLMWRGPKTLPKIGQALGRGVKSAKDEAREVRSAMDKRDGGPSE
jgi:Sec-independent protein translocase protein TatA